MSVAIRSGGLAVASDAEPVAPIDRPSLPRRGLSGAVVTSVLPDSPASHAGLLPGDELLAINGLRPRDVIDVRLDGACERVELDVRRGGVASTLVLEKSADEDLGLEFESPVFDRMKTCNNGCDFCFIGGLPPGLRRSLYVKDDDFRYSFLYGSFTTLTNLSEAEWRRLLFQRLSPLRVSVHATDLRLRRQVLGNPRAPDILAQLDELRAHGIEAHAQVVLLPGVNDGPILQSTIADLADRYPAARSVAVVPVGLTSHSRAHLSRPLTATEAHRAITLVERCQRALVPRLGTRFVFPSDELYLLAGRPLHGSRWYEDFPQLQNGVGLLQLFREGWRRALRRVRASMTLDPPRRVAWVTGQLVAASIEELAADLGTVGGLDLQVVAVENSLFGSQVTVAGLVPARDIVRTLSGQGLDRAILPRTMFNSQGGQTVDGISPAEIADQVGFDVVVASTPQELLTLTLSPRNDVRPVTPCVAS